MRAAHKLLHTSLTSLILLMLAIGWLSLPARRTTLSSRTSAASLAAALELSQADSPDPVLAGNNITYTVTLRNLGPDVAQTTSLSDVLPPATTFQSLASPPGWTCTMPNVGASGTINCNIASFPLSQVSFTIIVR